MNSVRLSKKYRFFPTSLWLLVAYFLTACDTTSFQSFTISPLNTPQSAIGFPVQLPLEGTRYVMLGGVIGKLAVHNGCLRINDSYTPLWPPGFTLDTTAETIRVRNEDGQVIARVGDEVSMGGVVGGIGFSFIMDEPLPPGCAPPYWITGHWQNSITTYVFTNESAYFIRRPPDTTYRVPNNEVVSIQLVINGGCFYIQEQESEDYYGLLWPPDFTMHEEAGDLYLINGDGKRVAKIGDTVRLRGGKEKYEVLVNDLLAGRCIGPFWEVSEVIKP